jgi:thiosulfate reductase cytochrome b subunit
MVAVCFIFLAFTGFVILRAHPRLYWGEVGNDLTPALFELPISRNYQHGGWEKRIPFFKTATSPVSAARTYDIYNQNAWGRSLHFLSAWVLVITGMIYLLIGFFSGHFRKHLWPTRQEFNFKMFWREIVSHLRLHISPAIGGPQYGLLQKCAYTAVVFFLLPLVIVTGLTMSPAITAAFPFLLRLFSGFQSARTIHFFASLALEFFLILHIVMVILSGFKKQISAMTFGK